jgi:starch-binding outer membrane protein, SusD/RagB family
MKKIFLYTASALLVLSSCKKTLDLLPTDNIIDDQAFLTMTDLQRGLNTAYARYNGENTAFLGSLLADELRFGRDNGGQGQFVYRFTYNQDPTTGGDVVAGWGGMYRVIEAANRVLANIDRIPSVAPTDNATKVSIRAQCLALRAFAHYELAIRYGRAPFNASDPGIPVITSLLPTDATVKPSRGTMGQTFNAINADLRTADTLIGNVTAANFTDLVFNRNNINGLQARVALYQGDWLNARRYADSVLTRNFRPLDATNFPNVWTDAALNTEVLLRFKRNAASLGATFTTTTGLIQFSPSVKLRTTLVAPPGATDTRSAMFTALGASPATNPANFVVFKFWTSALGGRINDFKSMRTSEMLLIRAEANLELQGTAGLAAAAADYNALRAVRITGYAPETFTSVADGIQRILDERMRELCFEGFRFFDLKRRGLGITRFPVDVESVAWESLPAGNFRFALPIPVSELQANPNIQQNPNY